MIIVCDRNMRGGDSIAQPRAPILCVSVSVCVGFSDTAVGPRIDLGMVPT